MNFNRIAIIALSLLLIAGCSKKPEPAAASKAEPSPAPQAQAVEETHTFTKPVLSYAPKPAYPDNMLNRCIEGEVQVQMRVTTEGIPEDPEIVKSTGPEFSQAILGVVPQWRFTPARSDGVAVARTVSISVPFIIRERPIDLPPEVSGGKPELLSAVRPDHPGKGEASALVSFTLLSGTIVSDVKIVKSEGTIDEKNLVETLSQWVFVPSASADASGEETDKVQAMVTFTQAGNVLIQYPYPPPGEKMQ